MNKLWVLTQAASGLRNIRARTWLLLGAAGLAVVGLLAWVGIALLTWLWGQLPVATDMGKRAAGEAMTHIEQVVPDLKEQVEQWVPGFAPELPAGDVSGTDIGPVPRYPGLVRSQFARAEQSVEVRYAGRAGFDAVLVHYVQGFAAAGYVQEVKSATAGEERHRFRRGQESVDLSLLRRSGGQVEVRLSLSSR